VKPGVPWRSTSIASVPRKRVRTSAIAEEIVECADGY